MPKLLEDEEDNAPPIANTGGMVTERTALAAGNEEQPSDDNMANPDWPGCAVFRIGAHPFLGALAKIAWFRREHPNWGIITEELENTPRSSKFRATVLDETGRIIATGHKVWNVAKNTEIVTCAESSAIARALENAGFSASRALAEMKLRNK